MPKIDRNLIFIYSNNARCKIKEASNMLNKSPQRLKYSIKVLEKEEILYNLHSVFDYSYFGLILFKVYFKGGYISEKDKDEIIKKLSQNPYITSIYELSGQYDLVVEVASPNPSRFNKVIKKVAKLATTLNNYKIILNLVTHIYPNLYLLDKQKLAITVNHDTVIGGDRKTEIFTVNELKIIKNLAENPKIRKTTLAKLSDINVKTANSIISDLTKRKILRGFRYKINPNKLNLLKYRLFLKLHNLDHETEAKITKYMEKQNEIVQMHKTVGDWDMEIDIETRNKIKLRRLVINIREKFKELIENFDIIEFYDYYKKSTLPRYLFEENIEF